jgi:uncharacterized membrane protein
MINWAHLHLMVNHFPVIGILFALLLFLYGLARRSEELKKAGLGAFVLIALMTVPVYFTGEAAQKVVKNLPGITEDYIGRHEEVAGLALILIEALGIVCLAGLIFFRRSASFPKWFTALVLVLSISAAAVVGFTANLGGQIRHTEIRGK